METGRRGWFITLEGPEGSGKTAQAERLRTAAVAAGRDVVIVREPGGTAAGEGIRAMLMDRGEVAARFTQRTDALLFNAARAQLVDDVIRPALARGALVVSDRYFHSTLAYQGFGGGLDLEPLLAVCAFATGGLLPDRILLFDLPVEVGLARKSDAETTRFEEHFDRAFHERVRAGYLRLAGEDPARWIVIDATAPEADVALAVRAALADLAGLGDRLEAGAGAPSGAAG